MKFLSKCSWYKSKYIKNYLSDHFIWSRHFPHFHWQFKKIITIYMWPLKYSPNILNIIYIFLKRFNLFFREGKGGRKRGRETSVYGCLSRVPCWGPGRNPGMCPDWEPNQRCFGSQAGAQPLSPTRQGKYHILLIDWVNKISFHILYMKCIIFALLRD